MEACARSVLDWLFIQLHRSGNISSVISSILYHYLAAYCRSLIYVSNSTINAKYVYVLMMYVIYIYIYIYILYNLYNYYVS